MNLFNLNIKSGLNWYIKYHQIVYNFHKTYNIKFFDTIGDDINSLDTYQYKSSLLMKYYKNISDFYKICEPNYLRFINFKNNGFYDNDINSIIENSVEESSLNVWATIIITVSFSTIIFLINFCFGDYLETQAYFLSRLEPQMRHLNVFRYHKVLKLGCAKVLQNDLPMPIIEENIVAEIAEDFFESVNLIEQFFF